MADLITITVDNNEIIRCLNMDDANDKAKFLSKESDNITLEIIPENGGPMTTLEYDKASHDWVCGD